MIVVVSSEYGKDSVSVESSQIALDGPKHRHLRNYLGDFDENFFS